MGETLNKKFLFEVNSTKLNCVHKIDSELLIGCKNKNLHSYDLELDKIVWKAKDYDRDELNLRAKVDNIEIL